MSIVKRQEKQIARSRIPFPAENLAAVLGFMEFIAEDELQEPGGGISVVATRICEP